MNPLAAEKPKLHPVLWVAAVSVTIASLVAVAAMTGMLPRSQASTPPAATLAVQESTAIPKAPEKFAEAVPVAPTPVATAKPAHQTTRKTTQVTRSPASNGSATRWPK